MMTWLGIALIVGGAATLIAMCGDLVVARRRRPAGRARADRRGGSAGRARADRPTGSTGRGRGARGAHEARPADRMPRTADGTGPTWARAAGGTGLVGGGRSAGGIRPASAARTSSPAWAVTAARAAQAPGRDPGHRPSTPLTVRTLLVSDPAQAAGADGVHRPYQGVIYLPRRPQSGTVYRASAAGPADRGYAP